jgi:anti-anti-sigma regulatory factor
MAIDVPGDASQGLLELRDALAVELRESDQLVLNAGGVQRVSTASLQILLGAIRAAEQRGIPARWEAASPALVEAAACLGLSAALKLSNEARAAKD